jgi:pimeloyl-ACP methyl ester carboxylesterase
MGGAISLLYTGAYPETVKKLAVIEGIIMSPRSSRSGAARRCASACRTGSNSCTTCRARPAQIQVAGRGAERMRSENPFLSPEQARHLTIHGVNQNEDGTFSWKFDNYVRAFAPYGFSAAEITSSGREISCPTLLIHGADSWMSTPQNNGALEFFANAETATIEKAGHWVHHDRLREFLASSNHSLNPDVKEPWDYDLCRAQQDAQPSGASMSG